MPTPGVPLRGSNNPPPLVYNEYCYMVQVYASPGEISWAGTYGPSPTTGANMRQGDGITVKSGMAKEGRITGGNLTAFSEDNAKEQLDALYGSPGTNYRLISLDKRGVIDLS